MVINFAFSRTVCKVCERHFKKLSYYGSYPVSGNCCMTKNADNLTPNEKKEITEDKSSPGIKMKQTGKGAMQVEVDHKKFMEVIGAKDKGFMYGFLEQLINAGTPTRSADDRGLNFMVSVVKSIEPKDQIEAMLASQMAAVQMATMTFARRLAHVENIDQQDSAIKGFTKLTRCFTAQVEALKKYRSNGQQKVTVEHVTVNEGGQAIVGSVDQGGRGEKRN